jgi:hypothetical protein
MLSKLLPMNIFYVALAVFGLCTTAYLFGAWRGYSSGKEVVQVAWDRERVQQQRAIDIALLSRSKAEDAMKKQFAETIKGYEQKISKANSANAAARRELGRLRNTISSISKRESANPSTPAKPDGPSSLTGELLAECGERLVGLAEQAGKLSSQVSALQGWITALPKD